MAEDVGEWSADIGYEKYIRRVAATRGLVTGHRWAELPMDALDFMVEQQLIRVFQPTTCICLIFCLFICSRHD